MSNIPNRHAVIWGAGKIGRGFLAEIFQDAGCTLTFIEYDKVLVQKLKDAGSYTIHKAIGLDIHSETIISGYNVYNSCSTLSISNALIHNPVIAAIAVHPSAVPEVIRSMAPAIMHRARHSPFEPLDIILCINMPHPSAYCRKLLKELLPQDCHDYLDNQVGLIDSVVMRICPETPPQMLDKDPLMVLTNGFPQMPVDRYAFKGPVPSTDMLYLSENIQAEEIRKIYTLNMAHAILAYLGTFKGYTYVADCMQDPWIRHVVSAALDEAAYGLFREFNYTRDEMDIWNRQIIHSLENPVLMDSLKRLGADSSRKLGKQDRLCGPALLCIKHGIWPSAIIKGIAYGFNFMQAGDRGTEEVQAYLHQNDIDKAIRKFCNLEDEKLIDTIKKEYLKLNHP